MADGGQADIQQAVGARVGCFCFPVNGFIERYNYSLLEVECYLRVGFRDMNWVWAGRGTGRCQASSVERALWRARVKLIGEASLGLLPALVEAPLGLRCAHSSSRMVDLIVRD